MRCAYQYSDVPCMNTPDDGRRVPLPNGDHLTVLLCRPHVMAFDAVMAAERERERRRQEQEAACRCDPTVPFIEDFVH